MSIEECKVGDKIVVSLNRYTPDEVRTVARVMKNGVEDAKGCRWTMRGRQFGRSASWHSEHARKYKPEDDERIKEQETSIMMERTRNRIQGMSWHGVPDAKVLAVAKLLDLEVAP